MTRRMIGRLMVSPFRLWSVVVGLTVAIVAIGQAVAPPGSPASAGLAQPAAPRGGSPTSPLVIVAIFDGLRPDSINPDDTPTLARLRQEGVSYSASHASFPTVTRVNGSTLATGTYPERHGVVSNTLYVPAVDPATTLTTADWRLLAKVRDVSNGRLQFTRTIGEILQANGLTFVAASSGSTGSGFVLNAMAPSGVGTLINGQLEPGTRVAFPDRVSTEIIERFGAARPDQSENSAGVDWTERALREYVLPELRPDVLFTWLTEPDGAQHEHGVGSAQARAALKNSDRNFGLLLDAQRALDPSRPVNVIVTSDHGFAHHDRAVNVKADLIASGLKASAASDDVVVVSDGQSVQLYVKGRDAAQIQKLVTFLQGRDEVDAIFTRGARAPGSQSAVRDAAHRNLPVQGHVPGTFALELLHAANDARAADVVFSLRWAEGKNRYGVSGVQAVVSDTRAGMLEGDGAGHGGLNPWSVRNTLVLWGPAFARGGRTLDTPAGIVDIAPTVLALQGIATDTAFDGRVLREALTDAGTRATGTAPAASAAAAGAAPAGPAAASAAAAGSAAASDATVWHDTVTVTSGRYTARVRVSGVGDRWYVDEGSRVRTTP